MIGALLLTVALSGVQLKVQTARADWYAQPGLKVNVAKCEKSLAKYEELFGVRVPRFQYIRVRGKDRYWGEVSSRTDLFAPGTVVGLTVVATEPCSEHEIVHLVTRQLGVADAVSEEGVAVLLAHDTDRVWGWAYRARARQIARYRHLHYDQINAILHNPGTVASEDEYLLAEGWVRHLKKRGFAQLVRFFQLSGKSGDPRKAFLAVYGTDVGQAFDAWLYGSKKAGSSRK